jgi:hypothetical protein
MGKRADEFWAWFDKQPSYIQATQNSNDPQVVADVVSGFLASATPGDTGRPATPPKRTAAKPAAEKPVISSLDDVPGGSNPSHDEAHSLAQMDPLAMYNKMSSMDPSKIEALLQRAL